MTQCGMGGSLASRLCFQSEELSGPFPREAANSRGSQRASSLRAFATTDTLDICNVSARMYPAVRFETDSGHLMDAALSTPAALSSMAKLVFGMNQSLDGYVDHLEMRTGPALFRHWIEHVRDLTGSVYGRRMYEAMRYWDEDRPEWSAEQHEFAAAWRRQPKWVVSRSLKSVGPNATLVEDDIEAVIRGLKARLVGEIAVSGPDLARSLTDLGLIDEYQLYFHPVVLGRGKPFFAGPRPPLRLVSTDPVGEDTVRLTYVPA